MFNSGAFAYAQNKDTRPETTLYLEHGKPLIFGKNKNKGIRLNGLNPEVVELGLGVREDDLLFHDEKTPEATHAYLLAHLYKPAFPEPLGVFRDISRPCYDDLVRDQVTQAVNAKGAGDLQSLFDTDDSWDVT